MTNTEIMIRKIYPVVGENGDDWGTFDIKQRTTFIM